MQITMMTMLIGIHLYKIDEIKKNKSPLSGWGVCVCVVILAALDFKIQIV